MSLAAAPRGVHAHLAARRMPGHSDGELAALAEALAMVCGSGVPEPWRTPAFGRRVDGARLQLSAALSRAVLAASFEREACRLGPATQGATRHADAVRVAYALRWMELASGTELPTWTSWLDQRDGRPRAWGRTPRAGAPRRSSRSVSVAPGPAPLATR